MSGWRSLAATMCSTSHHAAPSLQVSLLLVWSWLWRHVECVEEALKVLVLLLRGACGQIRDVANVVVVGGLGTYVGTLLLTVGGSLLIHHVLIDIFLHLDHVSTLILQFRPSSLSHGPFQELFLHLLVVTRGRQLLYLLQTYIIGISWRVMCDLACSTLTLAWLLSRSFKENLLLQLAGSLLVQSLQW